MREITLTKGKVAIIDDEDYDRLINMGKWCENKGYAYKTISYINEKGKRSSKPLLMHRVIMNATQTQ